jgi:hypothetical protein
MRSAEELRLLARFGFVLGVVALVGCGGSARIELSGDVTHGGKPIPTGRIYFDPDISRGNKGPQGFAEIKDGRYDTRNDGRGAVAGPTIVKIDANDGSFGPGQGLPLFDEFSIPTEISSSSQNFDVPANAPKTRKVPAKKM